MAGKRRFTMVTPPDPREDELQQAIAQLLDQILIEGQVAWSHFPAGGYQLTPAARARLYRLGLKPGFPDIMILFSQARVLWLEVKTRTGVLSKDQSHMHALLRMLGHTVKVVRSLEDVIGALQQHRVPMRMARLGGFFGETFTRPETGDAAQPAAGAA